MTTRNEWRKAWRRMRCRNGRGALPRDRMGILAARCYYDRMTGDRAPQSRRLAGMLAHHRVARMFPDGVRFRPLSPMNGEVVIPNSFLEWP